ncbi:MAG TPA: hypothetical protein VJZ76_06100 [Thermoanaerobaculia bacterium]|nr:hypothetical protein [Thermoanaerobaculia bacterium]
MRRVGLAAVLLLCSIASRAQEFEIFDPNDFIDPRERGAVFAPTGWQLLAPGSPFSVVRVYGGQVSNYQWRDTPTGADLTFAHVVWNRYRDNRQFNLKLTTYDVEEGAHLPWYRGTIQFARYFAIPTTRGMSVGAGDPVRAAGRILFTGSLEQNPLRETDVRARVVDHEFGIEVDAYLRTTRFTTSGSVVWTRRVVDDGRYADRLVYFYRGPEISKFDNRLRFAANLACGGEHTDRWRWGATRLIATTSIDLPTAGGRRLGTVNLAWGPSYLPGSATQRTQRELAIYFDRTVMAHLGPLPLR